MTVSNQTTKCIYRGNGVNRKWGVPFPADLPEHVAVWLTSPDGKETRLQAGYALDAEDGAIIYPLEGTDLTPLPAGWKITLLRQTPLTQEVSLARQGELDAKVLERAYDKTVMMVQELSERVSRSIQTPASEEDAYDASEFLREMRALYADTKALKDEVFRLAELTRDLACGPEDNPVEAETVLILQGEIDGRE